MAVSCLHNEKYAVWPIFMAESPKFLHHIGNQGSANTVMTSDFCAEVEIWPFRACAMKNMQLVHIYGRIAKIGNQRRGTRW